MMSNYVHTLAYNLVSETEKAVSLLYNLNDKKHFKHIIVDVGFPLLEDKIPQNISKAKNINSNKLFKLAKRYGSMYVKIVNVGVSQNWTTIYKLLDIKDDDCLVCADPDEHPLNRNWVKAISDVLLSGNKFAWCCLTMPEHLSILNSDNTVTSEISGHKIYEVLGSMNWAQGGFSGDFLNKTNGIPYLDSHPIYGYLESASLYMINKLGYKWCMLPDYLVNHTDYELNSKGSSRLLREWKNEIIFNDNHKITFEEWLLKK